jgi:DnaK suppressor protein
LWWRSLYTRAPWKQHQPSLQKVEQLAQLSPMHPQDSPARKQDMDNKSAKEPKSQVPKATGTAVRSTAIKAGAKPSHAAPGSDKKPPVKLAVKAEKATKSAGVKPVPAPPLKAVLMTAVPKVKTPVQVNQPVSKVDVQSASPASAAVPAKAGRPSSRLAQLTVPSMAQAVASTAAKASYAQAAPSALIVPMMPSAVKKDAKLVNSWKTKPLAELTDADLMAMPDAEYMNEVQMAAFRLKLQILKRDILSNAGETTEHLREDTSVVPDPADRATIEEEHALELRTRDRERKLLKKIEQSIARIEAGDYGYCDETGEPIGIGRLLARPTATLSLEAQQRRELKQKMFGD